MGNSALANADRIAIRQGVRNPVTRSGSRSFRGYYSEGAYESRVEREAAWVCASCENIDTVTFQPLKIRYRDGDRIFEHTPDILAQGPELKIILECKLDEVANSDAIRRRTALVRPVLARYGYQYAVWKYSQIQIEPRYSNAKTLEYFRWPGPTQALIHLLTATLPFGKVVTVADLIVGLNCLDATDIFPLIAARWLSFDGSKVLSPSTQVTRREIGAAAFRPFPNNFVG